MGEGGGNEGSPKFESVFWRRTFLEEGGMGMIFDPFSSFLLSPWCLGR